MAKRSPKPGTPKFGKRSAKRRRKLGIPQGELAIDLSDSGPASKAIQYRIRNADKRAAGKKVSNREEGAAYYYEKRGGVKNEAQRKRRQANTWRGHAKVNRKK